jgi:hypothetical protein
MGFRHHRTVELGRGAGMSLSSGGIGISARIPDLPAADAAASDIPLPAPSPATFELRRRHQFLVIRRGSRAFGRGLEALAHGNAGLALTEMQQAAAGRGGDLASVQLFTGLCLMQLDRMPEATASLGSVVGSDVPLPDRLMRQHLSRGTLEVHITPNVTAHTGMDRGGVALLLSELLQHTGQSKRSTDLLETYGARTHSTALALCLADRYLIDGAWEDVERVTDPFAINVDDLTLHILILRARAQRERGAFIPTLTTLREALRFKDRDAYLLNEARYERALVYEAGGKRALARKDLERIHDHEPEFRDVATRLRESQLVLSDYDLELLPTEAG